MVEIITVSIMHSSTSATSNSETIYCNAIEIRSKIELYRLIERFKFIISFTIISF